jgi:hypothetical protein
MIVRNQGENLKACDSCAATERDGAALGRKPHGRSLLCVDCEVEATRVPSPIAKLAITRRSYRAALRHRRASAQMDLVDMIVKAP